MRNRSLPYVAPFVVLLAALVGMPLLPVSPRVESFLRVVILAAAIGWIAWPVLDLSLKVPVASFGVGVLVFLVWIGPDLLFPTWHAANILSGVVGTPESGFPVEARGDWITLTLRSLRAAVLVPIIEELFWRGWLPRWIIDLDFEKVPLGTFTPFAFIVTAILFGSEHGAFWDVGIAAGVIYNWWIWRTRSLGDCILAHAVTNACLAGYVVLSGRWEYW